MEKACHEKPVAAACTDTLKAKFVFEHVNATHHLCKALPEEKCSSSPNAFVSMELCEKTCHHDDHH